MKLFLELLPLLLFVLTYKLAGIYWATAVLMGSVALQMLVLYSLERKLQPAHKLTLVLVWVFGALTLLLHDDRFIRAKPTILYLAMAAVLAVFLWALRKNPLQLLLGSQLDLPQNIWKNLGVAWFFYFIFMGLLNAYVAWYYSLSAWVDFKLWGYIFPLVFMVGQGVYIAKHLKKHSV